MISINVNLWRLQIIICNPEIHFLSYMDGHNFYSRWNYETMSNASESLKSSSWRFDPPLRREDPEWAWRVLCGVQKCRLCCKSLVKTSVSGVDQEKSDGRDAKNQCYRSFMISVHQLGRTKPAFPIFSRSKEDFCGLLSNLDSIHKTSCAQKLARLSGATHFVHFSVFFSNSGFLYIEFW